MPWCPKCKTEYREGITICADCKVELVAEYKDALLQDATEMLVKVDAEHQMFVKKMHDFLEYSGIPSVLMTEGDMIGVYVAPENYKQAKKCFKAFYSVETELVSLQQAAETAFMKGEEFDYFGEEDGEEDESTDATTEDFFDDRQKKTASGSDETNKEKYTSAATKYEDYRSSGVTFTVLGVLGVGFALLNFIDVIDLFGNNFSCFVLFAVFGIFLALGIFSFSKADQLKESAENEKKLVAEANEWMEKNFSLDMLVSLDDNGENTSDGLRPKEILYMDCIDKLVERLLEAFPDLHDSLAEQLVEDFCSRSDE
ncbi:MAG: hypothetical protein IJX95_06090 [Lachnospiraceae bacterium]|nr:hypothetical protein [Lachnospiraceae bacterium]